MALPRQLCWCGGVCVCRIAHEMFFAEGQALCCHSAYHCDALQIRLGRKTWDSIVLYKYAMALMAPPRDCHGNAMAESPPVMGHGSHFRK